MALATTCPHCKTSFKVVADQLKLRRGLVRCGKCQEVFSGVDYLRYIDEPRVRVSPPVAAEPELDDLKTAFFLPETMFDATQQVDPVSILAPVPAYLPSPESPPKSSYRAHLDPNVFDLEASLKQDMHSQDEALSRVEAAALKLSRLPQGLEIEATAPVVASRAESEMKAFVSDEDEIKRVNEPVNSFLSSSSSSSLSDAREISLGASETEMVEDFASHEQASLRPIKKPGKTLNKGRGVAQDIDRGEPAAIELYPVATPQPSHTYAWLTPAMILFIALALQFLLVMRHEIAARFPEYKTQLLGLLAPLGLSLELPRKYEAITIESFELQASEPNGGEAQYFYAQALLRNRSAYAVQWPAIELSLTDPAGQLLARKVLLASDYLGSPEAREQGFAARSEKSLRIKLSLNQITPNGYSAVLFYP